MPSVRSHFARQSVQWSDRYCAEPRGMADLDLALRRECVHRMLWPMISQSIGTVVILDVGCGTGDVLDGLPRDLVSVIGIDCTPEMAARAQALHPGDAFLAAEASALPFSPESSDIVISLGTLEYLREPEGALAAIHRTLRNGGSLVVSVPNRRSIFRRLLGIERTLEHALHQTLGRNARGAVAKSHDAPLPFHRRWSVGEACQLIVDAGFEIERTRLHTMGPWGRIGRMRAILRLSRFASNGLGGRPGIAGWLANTIVIQARKHNTVTRSQKA